MTPLPRRRPWKLAREAVTLDHLLSGRLILGVGIGTDRNGEFSSYGESPDAKRHGEMFDEGLELLVKLWSGETFSYGGTYYQISQVRLLPVPVQHPHIPLWIASHWPDKRPLRRAARWNGVCSLKVGSELTPAEWGEIQAYLALHRTSTALFAVVASGRTTGTEKGKDATKMAQLAEVGVTWWQEYLGARHRWARCANVSSMDHHGSGHKTHGMRKPTQRPCSCRSQPGFDIEVLLDDGKEELGLDQYPLLSAVALVRL